MLIRISSEHQLADDAAALPVDRVVDPAGGQQDPEQPEDRAGRTDRRDVAAEDEARRRTGRGAGEVEREEAPRAVPALDDRAREVQGVHVEDQVEEVAVEQRHRPESPVLPGRDRGLVELEPGR